MKPLLDIVIASLLALAPVAATHAQTWPVRPVEIIVPYSAGGTGDIMARQLAKRFEQKFGQAFVVSYKAGASGTIGAAAVANAKPDGYTLLLGYTSELAIVPVLGGARYKVTDFAPIALAGVTPLVLVGRKTLPATNMKELIAALRRPGASYASAGNGSPAHFAGELFKRQHGLDLQHVPYKTGPQVVSDLIGNHVDIYFSGIPPAISQVRAGNLRPFAITGSTRNKALPDVETMGEAGVKDFDLSGWFALLAPAGTPAHILEQLRSATVEALGHAELQAVLENNGVSVVRMIGEDLGTFVAAEGEKYRRLARELQIRAE